MEILESLALGAGTALAISPFAEWWVHKHILHIPKNERDGKPRYFIRASESHHDEHHHAFKGPAHYYQDLTNEHAVSTFSTEDRVTIGTVGGLIGMLTAAVIDLARHESPGLGSMGYSVGTAVGAMLAYGAYEFTHHYFHNIGERRLHINQRLGDLIQGDRPDGRLRFSKPLLDSICTVVDNLVDRDAQPAFPPELIEKFRSQLAANHMRGQAYIAVAPGTENELLHNLTYTIAREEREKALEQDAAERKAYARERRMQRVLRNTPYFTLIDNHHFVHHYKQNKNLNIVAPLADLAFGTHITSSSKTLDTAKEYWLCPNSPDTTIFRRKDAA